MVRINFIVFALDHFVIIAASALLVLDWKNLHTFDSRMPILDQTTSLKSQRQNILI